MCHTARKRPQEKGSLPEPTACLPHNPQGRDLNCTEKPPCESNMEAHGCPLVTWTQSEVYSGAWVQTVKGPRAWNTVRMRFLPWRLKAEI